jgi:VanZ family protein
MSRAAKITFLIRASLVLLTVTVAVLVFGPFSGAEERFGLSDKEGHILAFYGLASLSLLAMPRMRKWDVVLICLAIGGLIEVIQPFLGRSGSITDWLADVMGVFLAVVPMMFEAARRSLRGDEQERTRMRRRSDMPQPAEAGVPVPVSASRARKAGTRSS